MRRGAWRSTAGVLALLAGINVTASSAMVQESAWALISTISCLAVLAGIRLHGPSAKGPWVILGVGLGLLAVGNLITHPALGSQPLLQTASNVGELLAFPCLGLAAWGLVRRQAPDGDREGAIDSAIVMVALATVLSGTVFTAEVMQANSALSYALLVVAPLTLAGVTTAAARLVFVGAPSISTYLLAGSTASGLIGHVLRTLELSAGTYEHGTVWDLFIAGAYAAAGVAALHPSMRRLTEPRPAPDRFRPVSVTRGACRGTLGSTIAPRPPTHQMVR